MITQLKSWSLVIVTAILFAAAVAIWSYNMGSLSVNTVQGSYGGSGELRIGTNRGMQHTINVSELQGN